MEALNAEETQKFHSYLENLHSVVHKVFMERFELTCVNASHGKLIFELSSTAELDVLWQKYQDGQLRKEFLGGLNRAGECSYHIILQITADDYNDCKQRLCLENETETKQRLEINNIDQI
jgi:hypothetical protein